MGLGDGMDLDLINPFEELVVFGKRLPMEPTSSTSVSAHLPPNNGTKGIERYAGKKGAGGRHLQLEKYTGKKGAGGMASKLQRYSKADLVPVARKRNSNIPTAASQGKRL